MSGTGKRPRGRGLASAWTAIALPGPSADASAIAASVRLIRRGGACGYAVETYGHARDTLLLIPSRPMRDSHVNSGDDTCSGNCRSARSDDSAAGVAPEVAGPAAQAPRGPGYV